MKHGNHDGAGSERHLHDPIEDRLVPLEPLDPTRVHSIDDLVRAMAKTAFTGRQLGEAADVLEAMARDKDCFVVMTLAGAMSTANALGYLIGAAAAAPIAVHLGATPKPEPTMQTSTRSAIR